MAKELERMGAHMLAIKDMAGLCRPYAAEKLVKALRQEIGIPIHFHTHDTSGINAASVLKAAESRRARGRWRHRVDERHHQPAESEFHRGRAGAHQARYRPRSRRAQPVRRLLGGGARVLRAVRHRPEERLGRSLPARDARRPIHQSQGAGRIHGPGRALARNRAHVRRGQPGVRRHRQGHAVQQGGRRHGHLPGEPQHDHAAVRTAARPITT